MAKKRVINQRVTEYVNPDTGEVVSNTTEQSIIIDSENEPFFMVFSKHMAVVYGINSISAVRVMWKFFEMAEYNTGRVLLPSPTRKELIRYLNISPSIFEKSLSLLKMNGIIKGGRGEYFVNPELHWRGTKSVRDAVMKADCEIIFKPLLKYEGNKDELKKSKL